MVRYSSQGAGRQDNLYTRVEFLTGVRYLRFTESGTCRELRLPGSFPRLLVLKTSVLNMPCSSLAPGVIRIELDGVLWRVTTRTNLGESISALADTLASKTPGTTPTFYWNPGDLKDFFRNSAKPELVWN